MIIWFEMRNRVDVDLNGWGAVGGLIIRNLQEKLFSIKKPKQQQQKSSQETWRLFCAGQL